MLSAIFSNFLKFVDFIFVMIGLWVQVVFMYKREWLFDRRKVLTMAIIAAGMFALSFVMWGAAEGTFKVPLMALLIFLALRLAFYKIFSRNPEDTFWSMDSGLWRDGIFNFLFWIIGTVVPIIVAFG